MVIEGEYDRMQQKIELLNATDNVMQRYRLDDSKLFSQFLQRVQISLGEKRGSPGKPSQKWKSTLYGFLHDKCKGERPEAETGLPVISVPQCLDCADEFQNLRAFQLQGEICSNQSFINQRHQQYRISVVLLNAFADFRPLQQVFLTLEEIKSKEELSKHSSRFK